MNEGVRVSYSANIVFIVINIIELVIGSFGCLIGFFISGCLLIFSGMDGAPRQEETALIIFVFLILYMGFIIGSLIMQIGHIRMCKKNVNIDDPKFIQKHNESMKYGIFGIIIPIVIAFIGIIWFMSV